MGDRRGETYLRKEIKPSKTLQHIPTLFLSLGLLCMLE